MKTIKRREFLTSAAALGAVTAVDATLAGSAAVIVPRRARPVVVASVNAAFYKNGGTKTGVEVAYEMVTKGTDVLDAVIAGININELDPDNLYVGYGALPNAEGNVELDASVMHGPKRRAGAVAALEGVRTPSLVAKAVMESTDNHLIVGKGAQNFARNMGFTIEPDLNTERSRRAWLSWKRQTDSANYLDPARRGTGPAKEPADPFEYTTHMYGTIHCAAVSASGEICGCTSTSGRSFKIPGRVGDSPILGAGLYVDGEVGAAGSTGRGEANLFSLASFLIVEGMRAGKHPKDAGLAALQRIRANTIETRLRKPNGDPNFNILFFAVNARGEHAGISMYAEDEGERGFAGQKEMFVRYAVCDENGPRMVNCEGLLPGTPQK